MQSERYIAMGYDIAPENTDKLRAMFPQFVFDVFEKSCQPAPERLERAEVLFGYGNIEHIPLAINAKYIHTMSAGIDGYFKKIDAHQNKNMLFSNSAGLYGPAVGEHALALLLAATHGIKPSVLGMQAGLWKAHPTLGDVNGSTVAILGTGDIGTNIATAVCAMGARVLGYKRSKAPPAPPYNALFFGEDGLDEMLAEADFIINCLPGTRYTEGLLNKKRISRIKKGAIFVNIGRGTVIDQNAMMRALTDGTLAAVATDVTDPEPLPQGHPLWQMDNVIITPHYSGWGVSPSAHADWFAQNLSAYLAGKPLPGAVNRKWDY